MSDAQGHAMHTAAPLDPEVVFSRPGSPQFPERHARGVFWIQALPEEQGRQALIHLLPDGSARTVTEPGYNIRSRVHEYGGRCHLLTDEHCLFVNFADQRLYRQPLAGGAVEAMTACPDSATGSQAQTGSGSQSGGSAGVASSEWMLADLCLHPAGRWLAAVGERTRSGQENENAVVLLDLHGDAAQRRWQTLASGLDFYAAPRFSPDGSRLCLLGWDHPAMPWDAACLHQAPFAADTGTTGQFEVVAGGIGSAACQADYCRDGTLVFALDDDNDGDAPWKGFWNLHRLHQGASQAITREQAEYGAAHWVFGHTRIRPIDRQRVLAIRTGESGDVLVMVDDVSTRELKTDSEFVEFDHLSPVYQDEILLMAASDWREPAVMAVNISSGETRIVHAGESVMPAAQVSRATPVRIATRDAAITHAWHYAPADDPSSTRRGTVTSAIEPQDGTGPQSVSAALPPLMVLVHGGPTSRAGCRFDPMRQFWTTRGFAVLDVNHRGSTGYGRRYRQALNGYWGLLDVDDVIDAIQTLVAAGKADPDRIFIRGGSAGGYAVLTALTRYPEVFAAGACYYGIGNLVTLAKSTHKFEARYLDSLLGQPWNESLENDTASVFYTRSPIHAIDRVRSPMILFQGSEDKVVPPAVSHEMVAALKAAGIRHRYVEYAGEGHGFRAAPNRIDALASEAAFYAEVSLSG